MSVLVYAVVVIGLVCVLNLALMLMIIKRLRGMGGDAHGRAHEEPLDVMTPDDDIVADFTATATTGEVVSRAGLTSVTLVGFFSVSCVSCKDKLPDFVRRAARMPGGRGQVIASVFGLSTGTGTGTGTGSAGAQAMAAQLEPVARVVLEGGQNQVFMAFQVRSFPAYCLIDEDGRILSKSGDIARLPLPVAA